MNKESTGNKEPMGLTLAAIFISVLTCFLLLYLLAGCASQERLQNNWVEGCLEGSIAVFSEMNDIDRKLIRPESIEAQKDVCARMYTEMFHVAPIEDLQSPSIKDL